MGRLSLHLLVLAAALAIGGASGVGLGTAPGAASDGMSGPGVAAHGNATYACRALEQHRAAIGHERPL
jgi:hypothetical protein